MALKLDISPRKDRGGGHKAAALSCLIVTAAAVLALVLIHLSMGPRDRLARFVPADAVVYVHAQGQRAVSKIVEATMFVPKNSADEIGLFALNLDGETIWTAALMWNRLSPPSEDESQALLSAGAVRVAPVFYILRASDGPIILSEGRNGSLIDDDAIDCGLSAMRGVSRIQAYADTTALLEGVIEPSMLPTSSGKMVLALSTRADGPAVLAVDIAEIADRSEILGFRLPDDADGVPAELMSGTGRLAITFVTDKNTINPLPLLFRGTEERRILAGTPESAQLDQARFRLAEHFAGALSLLVYPDDGAFAAYLPDSDLSELKNDILAYLDASFPKKSDIKLPDGRIVSEYIVEAANDGRNLKNEDIAQSDFPIASFNDGVLIASDAGMLRSMLAPEAHDSVKSGCLSGEWPTLMIDGLQEIAPKSGILPIVLRIFGFKDVVIHKIGDNSLFFCGY